MVNQRHFEPGPVRTSNWDPGYEETVLKEAAQEMNALDEAMKDNSNTVRCCICRLGDFETLSFKRLSLRYKACCNQVDQRSQLAQRASVA